MLVCGSCNYAVAFFNAQIIKEESIMTEKGITCEIVRPIAVLSENERGYTKEVNLVSWNGADPKYDIRNWHPDREKCGKGITLTEEEAHALMDALKEVFG